MVSNTHHPSLTQGECRRMSGKQGQTKSEIEQRRQKVFEYWTKGFRHHTIAEKLGMDIRTIQRDIAILRTQTMEEFRKANDACIADTIIEFENQMGILAEMQDSAFAKGNQNETLKVIRARQELRWKFMDTLNKFGEMPITEKPKDKINVIFNVKRHENGVEVKTPKS